jgi:hypothetical protein
VSNLTDNFFDWRKFYTQEFQDFVKNKLGKSDYNLNAFNVSLYECDEKEAFDQFFAYLEEFKLENEDLSNE